jgi:hypothetical protein
MSANSVARGCWLTGHRHNSLCRKYDNAGILRGDSAAGRHSETHIALLTGDVNAGRDVSLWFFYRVRARQWRSPSLASMIRRWRPKPLPRGFSGPQNNFFESIRTAADALRQTRIADGIKQWMVSA